MSPSRGDLPLLAIPDGASSVPTFELLEAARERCRLCAFVDEVVRVSYEVAAA